MTQREKAKIALQILLQHRHWYELTESELIDLGFEKLKPENIMDACEEFILDLLLFCEKQ